jgi:hypothetical protein
MYSSSPEGPSVSRSQIFRQNLAAILVIFLGSVVESWWGVGRSEQNLFFLKGRLALAFLMKFL